MLSGDCGGTAELWPKVTSENATSRMGIDIEQLIHFRVDETGDHLGRKTQCGRNREQVREQRAVVPAEMAVGAALILPGVAPVCAGADDGHWRMRNRGLSTGGIDQVRRKSPARNRRKPNSAAAK